MAAFRAIKPGTDTDTDAAAATTAIAGLRDRLARAETLNHPAVRYELHKLDELLIGQLDQVGYKPGRHRSPVSATAS